MLVISFKGEVQYILSYSQAEFHNVKMFALFIFTDFGVFSTKYVIKNYTFFALGNI